MSSLAIHALKRPAEYREPRGNIFPSEGSLAWFIRKNRPELVRAGALVRIGGQVFVNEPKFDAVLLDGTAGNGSGDAK